MIRRLSLPAALLVLGGLSGLVGSELAHSAPAPTQQSTWCNSGTYDYESVNAPCVWDSRHRGSRPAGEQGSRSFVVNRYGDLYFIRHVRAHCMLRPHEAGSCPGGKR